MPISASDIQKQTIIKRTIEEDQKAIVSQWINTFKYNDVDNAANKIAQLMFACVAQGEFKVRSSLNKNNQLTEPNITLNAIDYLSHASRIIIDYEKLSPENKVKFLSYFPKAGDQKIISRSATHAIVRKQNSITELKGFLLGVAGQLPAYLKTAYDFGVDIAMGGKGSLNFIGKKITDNGYSGHIYFHHNVPQQLLMIGLEQSAPASSLLDAIWTNPSEADEEVQSQTDQFGQGHSLTGASDVYTATGSLYFSDPVYQAKLLAEKGIAPPDKYGAMQVTLNDSNWQQILIHLETLNQLLSQADDLPISYFLMTPPKTATDEIKTINSFISLDFKTYLKRISLLLSEDTPDQEKRTSIHEGLQVELLSIIQQLQAGKNGLYGDLKAIIKTICEIPSTPVDYINAVSRILVLFDRQLAVDPELNHTFNTLLIQEQCEKILLRQKDLSRKAQLINQYFNSDHISKENGVGEYLRDLHQNIEILNTIYKELWKQDDAPIKGDIKSTESSELALPQEETFKDQTQLNIDRYNEKIQRIDLFLQNTPRLTSESLLIKERQATHQLSGQIEQFKTNVTRLEHDRTQLHAKIIELEATHIRLNEEKINDNATLEKVKTKEKCLTMMLPIICHLYLIEEKHSDLKNRGYLQDAKVALTLKNSIESEIDAYLNSQEPNLLNFKTNCKKHIETATPALAKHRGWGHVLGNLLAFILGLGIGYIIAGVAHKYSTGTFLFFNETKSMSHVSDLKVSIEKFSVDETLLST